MNKCKPKPCRNCKTLFVPYHSLKVCCSIPCEIEYATMRQKQLEKRRQKAAQAETNRSHREARERIRTRSDHLSLAQMAFNKYIRLRDKDEPCISCNRHHAGQYHAGHYRSIGAAPEIRFSEINVFKQCSVCNNHKSGNAIEYRINLVDRIGREAVEELEGPHPPLKLTIPEIIEIKKRYSKLARDLEKQYAALD